MHISKTELCLSLFAAFSFGGAASVIAEFAHERTLSRSDSLNLPANYIEDPSDPVPHCVMPISGSIRVSSTTRYLYGEYGLCNLDASPDYAAEPVAPSKFEFFEPLPVCNEASNGRIIDVAQEGSSDFDRRICLEKGWASMPRALVVK